MWCHHLAQSSTGFVFLFGTCVPRVCVWHLVVNWCRTGTNKVAKHWDRVMSTSECIVRAVRSSRPTSGTGSSLHRIPGEGNQDGEGGVVSQGHSRGACRAKTWSSWISVHSYWQWSCSVSLSVSPKCRNHITVLFFIMSVYQITWRWTRLSQAGTVLWLSPGSAPHFSWKKCNMSVFVWVWAGREQLSELYRQSLAILSVFFILTEN